MSAQLIDMFKNGRMIRVVGDRHGLRTDIAQACAVNEGALTQRQVNLRPGMRSAEFYEFVFHFEKF